MATRNVVSPMTRRAEPDQGRRDERGAGVGPEAAVRDGVGDRRGDRQITGGRGHGDEQREREAADEGVAEDRPVRGPGHPGQARCERQRHRCGGKRHRQEVEVQRELERDDAAGHPVRENQQHEQLRCGQRRPGPATARPGPGPGGPPDPASRATGAGVRRPGGHPTTGPRRARPRLRSCRAPGGAGLPSARAADRRSRGRAPRPAPARRRCRCSPEPGPPRRARSGPWRSWRRWPWPRDRTAAPAEAASGSAGCRPGSAHRPGLRTSSGATRRRPARRPPA